MSVELDRRVRLQFLETELQSLQHTDDFWPDPDTKEGAEALSRLESMSEEVRALRGEVHAHLSDPLCDSVLMAACEED